MTTMTMNGAFRIDFRFRHLDPMEEAVFWALGYGYRTPEALCDLLHIFAPALLSKAVYELARLGLVEVSEVRREISYSVPMARLLELARSGTPCEVDLPSSVPAPILEGQQVEACAVKDLLRALNLGGLADAARRLELWVLPP